MHTCVCIKIEINWIGLCNAKCGKAILFTIKDNVTSIKHVWYIMRYTECQFYLYANKNVLVTASKLAIKSLTTAIFWINNNKLMAFFRNF